MILAATPKHGCGHGQPHRLMPPACKVSGGTDAATRLAVVGAKCADCDRVFLAPPTRIPAWMMLTCRGPDLVQQYVFQHGCAWIAHEAARP